MKKYLSPRECFSLASLFSIVLGMMGTEGMFGACPYIHGVPTNAPALKAIVFAGTAIFWGFFLYLQMEAMEDERLKRLKMRRKPLPVRRHPYED